jgi:uncharacterized protein YndB with AHSA1/START domain
MNRASIADSPTAKITRFLDASPEEVFDAWTNPDQARRWMCPFGASVPDLTLEARVVGRLRAPSSRRPGVEPSLRRTCPP